MTRSEAYTLTMLALCIWRESRSEPDEGQIAVGCVVRERVKIAQEWLNHGRSHWWGDTYIEVITRKWQFSSITDPRDQQLIIYPSEYDAAWLRCLEIAEYVISGELEHPAPGATHFYARYIEPPRWTQRATFVKEIGLHKFYRLES